MNSTTSYIRAWQRAWRQGIAPQLSTAALRALRRALVTDDRRLIQGGSISPLPLQSVREKSVQGGCAICYAAWQGDGLATVAEVEEYFAHVCVESDRRLGEPAAVRYFLNPFDDWSREEMRRNLLPEVELALAARETPAAA